MRGLKRELQLELSAQEPVDETALQEPTPPPFAAVLELEVKVMRSVFQQCAPTWRSLIDTVDAAERVYVTGF